MKLASNVAAAGDGKPEKYFLFSISNFNLPRYLHQRVKMCKLSIKLSLNSNF